MLSNYILFGYIVGIFGMKGAPCLSRTLFRKVARECRSETTSAHEREEFEESSMASKSEIQMSKGACFSLIKVFLVKNFVENSY